MAPMRMSLNDLPDNAIAEILSHLPIKDAVRTSVLSRSWRNSWQHCLGLDVSGISIGEVSMVLLLHYGFVRLFRADDAHPRQRWRYHDIHGWLAALARHSASTLQTLILSFRIYNNNHERMTLNIGDIARDFPNLVHLDLACTLKVPLKFGGFAALRSLSIHKCWHYGWHASRLISACPLLETITMMNLDGWLCFDIVAPNLSSLELFNLRLGDFSITNAPLLEAVSIRLCRFVFVGGKCKDDDNSYKNEYVSGGGGGGGADSKKIFLLKFFQSMASIKKLELDHFLLSFLGNGYIPERIPTNFNNLKVISLYADLEYERPVLVILCLLRSAPNLQKLVIWRWTKSIQVFETGDDFWEAQGHTDLFNKLETVTISLILYEEVELGFIQFLLAKARVLKTMTIGFDKDFRNEMSVMTRLLGFPRVSSQARIILTSR